MRAKADGRALALTYVGRIGADKWCIRSTEDDKLLGVGATVAEAYADAKDKQENTDEQSNT